MIGLASRPGNRGAFLTQRVANGAAKTQRLNSLPQFHLLWVIRIDSAPARTVHTRGACPRRMAVLAGTGGKWSASDHSRKGEGLRILVEQSNSRTTPTGKMLPVKRLDFLPRWRFADPRRQGVHDNLTIEAATPESELSLPRRLRSEPSGVSVMSNSFAAVFHAAFHNRAGQPERCPCIRLSHRLV